MPTVITRTLKPSGGDYTTIAAWLTANGDATSQDLVANDEAIVLECYNGDYSGIAGGGDGYIGEAISPSGWTTDATRNITIRVVPESRHNGTPDSGLVWRPNGDAQCLDLTNDADFVIEGFDFRQSTNFTYRPAVTANDDCFFIDCIFRQVGSGGSDCVSIQGRNSEFYSCLFLSNGVTGSWCADINPFNNANFYNCAFIGSIEGAVRGAKNVTYPTGLTNCYAFNCGQIYDDTGTEYFTADSGFNATSNSEVLTPPASNPLPGNIGADNFMDADNNDFRLTPHSHLIAAGSDVSGKFSTDITGAVIPTNAWPIGPFFRLPQTEQGSAVLGKTPELYIPGRKPVGPVRVDRQHGLAAGLERFYLMGQMISAVKGRPKPIHIDNTGNNWAAGVYYGRYGSLLFDNGAGEARIDLQEPYMPSADYTMVFQFVHDHATAGNWNLLPGDFNDKGIDLTVQANGGNYRMNFAHYQTGAFQNGNYDSGVALNTIATFVMAFRGGGVFGSMNGEPVATLRASATAPDPTTKTRVFKGSGGWGDQLYGAAYCFGQWNRGLSAAEMMAVSSDPYQFLVPA